MTNGNGGSRVWQQLLLVLFSFLLGSGATGISGIIHLSARVAVLEDNRVATAQILHEIKTDLTTVERKIDRLLQRKESP